MTEAEDREIVERCVRREEGGWREFVDRFSRYIAPAVDELFRSLPELSRSVTFEDALQECFLAFVEDDFGVLRRYDGHVPLVSYLRVVAVRRVLNLLVAQKRFRRSLDPAALLEDTAPRQSRVDAAAARREEEARLQQALAELPVRERLLFTWVRADGMSYAQAGKLLDIPENSVGPTLARIRERLRQRLGNF